VANLTSIKLYQQVADDLKSLIQQAVYRPGDKLPSIRQLATQRKVSIATIQRALEELEIRHLIEARPKSGFYVRMPIKQASNLKIPMASLVPKTVHIHEFASHIFHQCDAKEVINLGTSYPATEYFPAKQIQQIASKVIRTNIAQVVEVHFSPGHIELRKVLAKRLSENGCQLEAEDLIITNGCLEALSLCLRAVAKPGDTVAIESPGFVGLFQLIESLGFKALEIPCHPTDGMSLQALQLAIEQWDIKAVAVVPSFSNPLGSFMPLVKRQKLVTLLAEFKIPLIEDDLLSDLSFDGSRVKPCKSFDEEGLVLYCSSASKTIASGLRVGWIAPGAFYKEVSYFKTFTNISAPNITQLIVAEFLSSGKYDRHIRQLTRSLAQRMFLFQQAIKRHFPQGTHMSRPQGGCILWVELPRSINGYQLFKQAIERKIAIIPGQLSSATSKFDHCIRINCAGDPDVDIDSVILNLSKIIDELLMKS
jgi:DNA-binding transcriptional MocR family regulator